MEVWINALEKHDIKSVNNLIKAGVDINETNDTNQSVLMLAIKLKNSRETIELLIENGADYLAVDSSGIGVLEYAVAYSNHSMVLYLVKEIGLDCKTTYRESAFTPLMEAVSYGKREIVELFIEEGCDISAVDKSGYSAIDFAKKMRKKEIERILLTKA